MTASPIPTAPTPTDGQVPPLGKSRPRWVKPALLSVGGIVFLAVGIAAGIATQQSTISSGKHQVAQLQSLVSSDQSKLGADKSQISTERTQVSTAQAQAKNALSIALTQVRGQYKSKFAVLQAREQKVAGLQAKLNRELGVVAKSTISADGVYVVGKDIPAGIYHTSGNGGGFSNQCYFATLGSTDTSNILDNNNFNGPETVDVSGAYAFQIQGGCTWHKIG